MKFTDVIRTMAFIKCLNSGMDIETLAKQAKTSAHSIRGCIRAAGFVKTKDGWRIR